MKSRKANDGAMKPTPPVSTHEKLQERIHGLENEVARCRREEAVLREARVRHRAMVEAFDGLIYICSRSYVIEFMNQRLVERTGYDGTGQLCYRVLHERDSVCPWCVNERIFQGETVRWEVRSPKDGHWYYVSNAPLFHPDGSVSKQAMIMDITDMKEAEMLLAAERQVLEMVATGRSLQEILDTLCLMIEDLAPETLCSVLLLDEEERKLFHGAAPSLPEDYLRVLDGIPVEDCAASCGTAVHRGEMVVVEDIQTSPLWSQYRKEAAKHGLKACWSIPILDSNGKIIGTFALYGRQARRPAEKEIRQVKAAAHLAGISIERRRYEKTLWEREERYRNLFENSRDAIYITSREGEFLDANPATQELLGYARHEIIGKINVRDIYVHPEDRDLFQQEIERKGSVRDYEIQLRRSDGTPIVCLLSATVWKSPEQKVLGYQGIFRDITELKTLERERANLISMFAHDMKSALIVIQGFVLRLLNKSLQINEDKKDQYLSIIKKETRKLEFLIDDFLDFSRLQTGKLSLNFSAASLDKELLELFEAYQSRAMQSGTIRLEMDNPESLPVIDADVNRLRRVFTNLLDNAFKFCRENGTISIRTRESDETVQVEIADEGIGIDAEDLPYIFDPFHRGKYAGKYEGYGVGLAAVKTIVEGHGGKVLVKSERGKGSVFTVALPKRKRR